MRKGKVRRGEAPANVFELRTSKLTTPPPNTFNPQFGATSCSPCQGGNYANEVGSSVCKTASAGKKPNLSHDDVENCPAGSFSVGGAEECTACETGKTSGVGAAGCSTCATCPVGRYKISDCSTSEETQCGDCFSGTASMGGDATSCTPCLDGFYSSTAGSSTCFACTSGTYTNEDNTACDLCPAGKISGVASSEVRHDLISNYTLYISLSLSLFLITSTLTHLSLTLTVQRL